MADHRAEQVVTALVTQITGLPTTTKNVFRGRVYPIAKEEMPGLLVYSTKDELVSQMLTLGDFTLTVVIEAHCRDAVTGIETILNKIRKEVTVAIRALPTLGLSFVFDSVAKTETLELTDGDVPGGIVRMEWEVLYRRSINDPSV